MLRTRAALPFDFKGGTSKKNFFFQFWTDFFKNWVLYAEFKKKTIGVEFFKIGPQLFEIFSFLCPKNDFFLIFARISKCISSYNFWARKKFWCHFVPLLTARKLTDCFFQFQSRLVSTKDFVIAFMKGRKIAKNAVFSIRLQWLREN